jgi:hypothetical protein
MSGSCGQEMFHVAERNFKHEAANENFGPVLSESTELSPAHTVPKYIGIHIKKVKVKKVVTLL